MRVLVVDDHASWRDFVSSELEKRPGLQVVHQAADGLEAVQKARKLKPDLVILDIGLPDLSGIEVARQILEHVPTSRILFLSQHCSQDMVNGALGSGAKGYVVKSDAGSELLPAVNAILDGKQFIGARVANWLLAPLVDAPGARPVRHEIEFYSSEEPLVAGFAHFMDAALRDGKSVIAIVTEAHRTDLCRRLLARGVDIEGASQRGRFTWVDVAAMLSAIMVDGLPDEARLLEALHGPLMKAFEAALPGRGVAACGEGAPTLWESGNEEAALRLEQLWDEIAMRHGVDTLCGYMRQEVGGDRLQKLCDLHSPVQPA